MSAPPDVFPYAENYDPSAQGQWSLERAPSMCGFEELDMVSPLILIKQSKYLCEGKGLHETNSEKGKKATCPLPEGYGKGQLNTIGF